MNGQPNQGLASLAGGMGGSPTLGGAPQTPPMPQGGAQKPQPTPQGQLDPKLLDALSKIAALKVREEESKARARILASMNQGNEGTVVEQLDKQNMEATKKELVDKLSGGIAQEAKQSMQPQGQPMAGGIASVPGANQAAQPEAMAAGGIVAFKKGGTDGEEDDQPVDAYNRASNETWLGQGIRRGKAAVKDVAGLLSLRPWATDPERVAEGDTRTNAEVEGYTPEGYKVNDRADQLKAAFDRQQAARSVSDERPATTLFDPMNPWARVGTTPAATLQGKPGNMDDPALVRREDMRRGIANVQRPPVAAINQTQRPPAAAPNLNIQTNPNYAPPAAAGDAGGLSGLLAEQLKNRIGAKPEDAEAAAIKKYKDLMAVDPELAAQLKADTAAERAALQTRSTREPSVYDKLRAFADVAPTGGQTWTMAGAKGAGNINRLEKEYEADRMAALSGLKGLSKAEYDKQQGEKEKLYGVGAAANKTALESLDKAMTNATHLLSTQSVAETARLTRQSEEKVAKERNESQEKIQRMHSAAMRDSRVIPLAEQMNAELIKADTEEKRNAIVDRYFKITSTINPQRLDAPSKDVPLKPAERIMYEAMLKNAKNRGDKEDEAKYRALLGETTAVTENKIPDDLRKKYGL